MQSVILVGLFPNDVDKGDSHCPLEVAFVQNFLGSDCHLARFTKERLYCNWSWRPCQLMVLSTYVTYWAYRQRWRHVQCIQARDGEGMRSLLRNVTLWSLTLGHFSVDMLGGAMPIVVGLYLKDSRSYCRLSNQHHNRR